MKRDRFYKRLFEIIPGLLTWTTIIGLSILAFIKPVWVAIFVITFDLYWVIRISYLTFLLVFAYRRLGKEKKIDWLKESKECYHGLTQLSILKNILYTPASARASRFKCRKEVRPIKTLGWCGIPDSAKNFGGKDLKRFFMFEEIAKITGLKTSVSYRNYTYNTMQNFYNTVDLLICTSSTEGGPLPVFEAVACGVPVISTNVGLVQEMASIQTFETVQQAVKIINQFNDIDRLQEYRNKQCSQFLTDMSMEQYVKYWEEFFECCARLNTTCNFQ